MKTDIYSRIKECELIIYKLINKYSNYFNRDDLYQAGCIGVIKASNNFKSNDNIKFSTYAYKYIMGEMIDFMRHDKNIIVSEEIYSIYKRYIKVKELLCNKYEREVSFKEISSYMGISEQYLLSVIEAVSFSKELDSNEIYSDDTDSLVNSINLEDAMTSLTSSEKDLIDYRYYFGYSQKETADMMGMSQAKISRKERLILMKIKDNI